MLLNIDDQFEWLNSCFAVSFNFVNLTGSTALINIKQHCLLIQSIQYCIRGLIKRSYPKVHINADYIRLQFYNHIKLCTENNFRHILH